MSSMPSIETKPSDVAEPAAERVTLLQVVTEMLEDGAQRILNKHKTVGAQS